MNRSQWNERAFRYRIGAPTDLAVRLLGGPAYAIVRLFFRATLEGVEHLPAGPYLLIGNHPPCLGTGEFVALMALWVRRFGKSRPIAGFTHVSAHATWPFPWLFEQIGAIPSTYAAAEEALDRGVPVVAFPGGDHEAFRPFWQKGADFGGREGFLRIARKANVPIVPMGIAGDSAPVLWCSRLLAYLCIWPRLVGLKRYGFTVLALLGALVLFGATPSLSLQARLFFAWIWASSPFALVSWMPARVRIRIGAPLASTASRAEVEAAVSALLA